MRKRAWFAGALFLTLLLLNIPANAQSDRRSAAEAYARVVDYPFVDREGRDPESRRVAVVRARGIHQVCHQGVDVDMTRFYAISAMVDLFEASELKALASFAATPEGRSALAKLPALGAILNPIVERQIGDAERRFRAR